MALNNVSYPLRFTVDYPAGGISRLTTFFRLLLVIPVAIVLGLLGSLAPDQMGEGRIGFDATPVLVFLPALLMILFRRKYPRWWFDWNVALLRLSTRISAYVLLLQHVYPSTDEEQAVHLDVDYPDVPHDLSRWMPVVKWLLALPHYIALIFLGIAALVVTVFAWFAILLTANYPRGLFDFVVGVERWGLRVIAYAFLLVTDRYPPFSLRP